MTNILHEFVAKLQNPVYEVGEFGPKTNRLDGTIPVLLSYH